MLLKWLAIFMDGACVKQQNNSALLNSLRSVRHKTTDHTNLWCQKPLCLSWPIAVMDSSNTGTKKCLKSKPTHRGLETSKNMFKHFIGEGHIDRSSLRQRVQNKCLQTIKCRRCQSVHEEDLSWHRSCHKVASAYVELLSCGFKQEQIVNTVTDCMVQITIIQIVLVSIWQTQYRWQCWRNHISMICLSAFDKLMWCSPKWLFCVSLGVQGSVTQINWSRGWKINL